MIKTKSITISQDDFHRIFLEAIEKIATKDLIEILILSKAGAAVEYALFCKTDEAEKPFKVDDLAFVIDNSGDNNKLVNQIVAVREVLDNSCLVANESIEQIVNFENLRKIKNG